MENVKDTGQKRKLQQSAEETADFTDEMKKTNKIKKEEKLSELLESELLDELINEETVKLKFCDHFIRIGKLCANCGEEIGEKEILVNATHNSDQIMQTQESAVKESLESFHRLKNEKKLILILDLDQTLIQSSLSEADCDAKFTLRNSVYYVKIRPFVKKFIRKISKLYELHVYTMGIREYAEKICEILDPTKKFFDQRIVTRTENNNELKKSIQRITSFSKNVLILDDRLDVWDFIPNVILIRPFCYFNTVDINDPTKVQKSEEFIKKALDWLQSKVSLLNDQEISDEYKKMVKNSVNAEISDQNIILEGEKFLSDHVTVNKKDNEIKKCYKILKKAHKKFFRILQRGDFLGDSVLSQKEIPCVSECIKLDFLKNFTFICQPIYQKHVVFLGGSIASSPDDKQLKYTINDSETAEKYDLINLSDFWLWECLYQRKYVDVNEYIIK